MSIDATETCLKPWRPVSRVLMTTDSAGTVWNYTVDLSRALGAYGVEVVLLSMGPRLTQKQHLDAWAIPLLSVYEEHARAEWMDDPWEDVRRSGEVLLELEQRFRPDVIHLNRCAHAALPFRAPVLVHAHSCALAYWSAMRSSQRQEFPEHLVVYRERLERGLRSADMVVTSTESSLRELSEHYGPFRDTRVVAHGCDAEAFVPDLKEDIVLSAGRLWDPGRNLTALASVSSEIPWPVYVADDDQRSPASLRTIKLPNPGALRCLGKLSRAEFASWYGRAGIYVQPGRYEPSGMAVLEAAVSGCALVLADIPSLRERWEDVAVFVDPDDEKQLAAAVNALIAERSSREALAHAARERALSFSVQRLATQNLALYTDLLSRRAGADAQAWARASRSGGNERALL